MKVDPSANRDAPGAGGPTDTANPLSVSDALGSEIGLAGFTPHASR